MLLLFKTTIGANLAKNVSILFIFYYLQVISTSILQAMGEVKIILNNSFFNNILRLVLILVLPFFPTINCNSIIYAVIFSSIISSIFLLISIFKKTNFSISIKRLLIILIILILSYSMYALLNYFHINYLLSIITVIIFNVFCFILMLRKKL